MKKGLKVFLIVFAVIGAAVGACFIKPYKFRKYASMEAGRSRELY